MKTKKNRFSLAGLISWREGFSAVSESLEEGLRGAIDSCDEEDEEGREEELERFFSFRNRKNWEKSVEYADGDLISAVGFAEAQEFLGEKNKHGARYNSGGQAAIRSFWKRRGD